MDVARTAVSIMGLEDKDTKDNTPLANLKKSMRILKKDLGRLMIETCRMI